MPIGNRKNRAGGWMVKLLGYEWKQTVEKGNENQAMGTTSGGNNDDVEIEEQHGPDTSQPAATPNTDVASSTVQEPWEVVDEPSQSDRALESTADSVPINGPSDVHDTFSTEHLPSSATINDLESDLHERIRDIYHRPSLPRSGISRIHECFRPEKVGFLRTSM